MVIVVIDDGENINNRRQQTQLDRATPVMHPQKALNSLRYRRVNLRTDAKSLGVTIPPPFILRKQSWMVGPACSATHRSFFEDHMRYRVVVWSAIAWIAFCLAPYLYALNDLITWR
jgi:hypothetical protein